MYMTILPLVSIGAAQGAYESLSLDTCVIIELGVPSAITVKNYKKERDLH